MSGRRPPPSEAESAGAGHRNPLISVVLPAYNAGALLTDALRSLCEQTFTDFEVIVVDDGSTDDTAERLAVAMAADQRVRCIHHPANEGLLASLADGLAAARGELIARLDADDLCHPSRLELQFAAMQADRRTVLCWTSYERRELATGSPLGVIVPPMEHASMQLALTRGNRVLHSSVMFRRDAVREIGGYRAEWYPAEDYDLWCRLLAHGVGVGLAQALVVSRVNPHGISSTNAALQADVAQRRAALEQTRLQVGTGSADDLSPRARAVAQRRLARAVRAELVERRIPVTGLDIESVRAMTRDLQTTSRAVRWAVIASVSPIAFVRFCWHRTARRVRG